MNAVIAQQFWIPEAPSQAAICFTVPWSFESIVEDYYDQLYRFALSLTHSESDAGDLTQQTFLTFKLKGEQLRDHSKVKSWLFTTLHRCFLQARRRQTRFPHCEIDEANAELPAVEPTAGKQLDSARVMDALANMDEVFRAPLALFYLEDYPYKDIAQILGIPLGTVKSRIARGIVQLQKLLLDCAQRAL
jgi:RNA polymerase sigma factor (sigma-70 family)